MRILFLNRRRYVFPIMAGANVPAMKAECSEQRTAVISAPDGTNQFSAFRVQFTAIQIQTCRNITHHRDCNSVFSRHRIYKRLQGAPDAGRRKAAVYRCDIKLADRSQQVCPVTAYAGTSSSVAGSVLKPPNRIIPLLLLRENGESPRFPPPEWSL